MNTTEQNGTLSELTPRQRRAVAALVACPTVEEAARSARVGRTTLYTWLKDETFADAVEQARREQSRQALDYLRSCMLRAVQRLNALLDSGNEAVSRQAAKDLLDFGIKAGELEELEERIRRLEGK